MPGGEGSWEAACSVSVGLDRCSTVLATVELEGGAVVAVLLVLLGQSIGGAPLMVTEERRVGYDGKKLCRDCSTRIGKKCSGFTFTRKSPHPNTKKAIVKSSRNLWVQATVSF